jgi:hypothetical protein
VRVEELDLPRCRKSRRWARSRCISPASSGEPAFPAAAPPKSTTLNPLRGGSPPKLRALDVFRGGSPPKPAASRPAARRSVCQADGFKAAARRIVSKAGSFAPDSRRIVSKADDFKPAAPRIVSKAVGFGGPEVRCDFPRRFRRTFGINGKNASLAVPETQLLTPKYGKLRPRTTPDCRHAPLGHLRLPFVR